MNTAGIARGRNAQIIEEATITEPPNLAFDQAGRKAWYNLYRQADYSAWDQVEPNRANQYWLDKLGRTIPDILNA